MLSLRRRSRADGRKTDQRSAQGNAEEEEIEQGSGGERCQTRITRAGAGE